MTDSLSPEQLEFLRGFLKINMNLDISTGYSTKNMNLESYIKIDRHPLVNIYVRGIAGGFRNQVIEMAAEAERAIRADCFRAGILLCAETLYRMNCEVILQYAKWIKSIQHKPRRGPIILLDHETVLPNYESAVLLLEKSTIAESIKILKDLQLFEEQSILDMEALRFLRNCSVHRFLFPIINPHDPPTVQKLSNRELIDMALKRHFPREYVGFKFMIEINGKEVDYIVDQVRLKIDIESLEMEKEYAVIALALLQTSTRAISDVIVKISG